VLWYHAHSPPAFVVNAATWKLKNPPPLSTNQSQDNLLGNKAPMATNDESDNFYPFNGLGARTAEKKKSIILVVRGDVASIKRHEEKYNDVRFCELV